MTREEAKQMLLVMQAYAEGKTVQYKNKSGEWIDLDIPKFENLTEAKVRIKPESFVRPFHDADECWHEMQKHKPFGWLKVEDKEGCIGYYCLRDIADSTEFKYRFENHTFADGEPFGIIEEEGLL